MTDDFARGETVTVTFSGTWEATPGQFYESDDFPRRVTAADLAQEMRDYGDLKKVLGEWGLYGYVEVRVNGELVWGGA